jgi:hypothetical protein
MAEELSRTPQLLIPVINDFMSLTGSLAVAFQI